MLPPPFDARLRRLQAPQGQETPAAKRFDLCEWMRIDCLNVLSLTMSSPVLSRWYHRRELELFTLRPDIALESRRERQTKEICGRRS